ncbi:anaphase-promoting complex subunit cdc27 [Actinomortierella wolfii]|nr:anaphase-promoting complex subunit cdc27 [Actinomortierella wolfii]
MQAGVGVSASQDINTRKEQDENDEQGSVSSNTRRKRTGSPEFTLSKPTFVPANSSVNAPLPHGSLRSSIHESPDTISFEKTPTPVLPSMKREASLGLIQNSGTSTERVPLKRGQKRNGLERTRSTSAIIAPASAGIRKRTEKSNTLTSTSLSSLKLKDALNSSQAQGQTVASTPTSSNTPSVSTATTAAPADGSEVAGPSGGVGQIAPPSPNAEVDLWLQRGAMKAMVKIFRILAKAYGLLALNKHAECIKEFESLPTEHLLTGWVQCQMAKCKFQTNDHVAAETYFARARQLEPYIQSDMELYSTCLWHLQKEVALSALSKELKDLNHLSPEAWVALGNAYSLKHDRDQALRCFERATQLDDTFAYAHTLSGHEYVENEEFDKAQAEYRRALGIDPRSFYAWYGLGSIYHKTGKDDLALVHYLEAKKLNPNHSVVLYWVGTIQERLDRLSEAVRSFDEALRVDPTNASARYRRAKVLVDMRRLDEAFQDLEELRQVTPNEPNIYMLQGRIFIQRGQKEKALRHLTWALELDTKSSHTIRDMIAELDGRHPESEGEHYDM